MLTFFFALLIFMGMLACIGGFVWWAIREHLAAKKYRYLIRLHQAMPPVAAHTSKANGPQWRIKYKIGKKVVTETVEATTEGEVVKKFIAYEIVELVKL